MGPMNKSLQQSLKTELLKRMKTARPTQKPLQSKSIESIPEQSEIKKASKVPIVTSKSVKSAPSDSPISHKKSRSTMSLTKKSRQKSKSKTKLLSKTKSSTDTYDIDSIPFNKSKTKKLSRNNSKKQLKSQSLGLLDAKKQIMSKRQSKELKNQSRTGFTVHTNRRVRLDDGRIGIVRFKGRTAFGKSGQDWIGIVIEYGKGQHNGSVNGRSYFRCREGKGVMVKPDRLIEDLGNPNTKELDDTMKRGSEEIQKMLKEIAKQRKEQRMKKKQEAMAAELAKKQSNYGGDVGWTPAKFDNYKQDDGDAFGTKLMHSKTLLDKNKNKEAVKKKKVNEI